jgi:DNA-binding transcriptional ArsR family regulator
MAEQDEVTARRAADLRHLLHTPVDPLLVEPTRLRIMAALIGLPDAGELSFTGLRQLLDVTDGNLGMHLRQLVEQGYIALTKQEQGKRTQSRYQATPLGRARFAAHIAALEAIAAAARPPGTSEPR